MINTKKVQRRELRFNSLAELSAELDRLQRAHDAGTLSTVGNWTPGQNLQHCARLWRYAIDGFPKEANPPPPVRWIVTLVAKRRATSGMTAPAGIKVPKKVPFLPDMQTPASFEQGMSDMREQIARIARGEKFKAYSPIFGTLDHDQWQRLQFGHCQSHLGFLRVD